MKFRLPNNRKKEVHMAVLIILAGNLLGFGINIAQKNAAYVSYLERNKYGEGAYEETLQVQTEGNTQEVHIFVEEQKYTPERIELYFAEAGSKLEVWLEKQMNKSEKISHNLEFPEQLDENPVTLSWSTDRPEILSWDGVLGENMQKTEECVRILCSMRIGESEKVWEREVRVCSPDLPPTQKLQREIQEGAENMNEISSEKLYLPQTLHGKKLQYAKKGENTGIIFCIGSVFFGLCIFPLQREKEKQREEKLKKEMEMDYPDIVEKLVLFLRAGFSIRKAIEKLCVSYMKNKEKYHIKERGAYEELVRTCREIEGGIYEADAYERLGKRCGLSQYKMLSVILVQNLKKGNHSILELLEREAASAGETRKRNARVKGEEASTKLLLPMVMQLIVVLIILIVPAFLSFM